MKPYYDSGGITIYNGDNRDVMPTLPAGGFDMVFTSPPYNLGNTSGGGFHGKKRMGHYSESEALGKKRGGMGKWSNAAAAGGLANGYGVFRDSMPHKEYVAWQNEVIRECWKLLTDDGAIFYNHKPRVLNGRLVVPMDYVPEELRDQVRQEIIWKRDGGINFSPAFYLPTHERIVVIAKDAWRLRDKAASGAGDVWPFHQEPNPLHPAPFPLGLPAAAITTVSPSSVLDPFAGIGTTLVAAKNAGKRATGIEIEERYCEIAANRLSQGVLEFSE